MTRLLEETYAAPDKIDSEAGVIRGVKVLGRVSANGREYSDRALREAAGMYEGVEVNIDHDRANPSRERKLLEGFGILKGSQVRQDGVYADLHYLKSHQAAPLFLERAQRFPDKVGLSHNAEGTMRNKGGKKVVESIQRVNSVDVVTRPATNKSLFESEQSMATKPLKEILESKYGAEKVTASKILEMDGMADMPVEAPAESSADDQAKAAFKAMVAAVLDDDSLADVPAKVAKIKSILQAQEKLMATPEKKPAEGDTPAEPTNESKEAQDANAELLQEMRTYRKERLVGKLLKAANLDADDVLTESLMALPDEAAMKKLIDREVARATQGKPAPKAKPLMESAASRGNPTPTKYPEDAKGFAAAIR